jgi:NAD(P)-dependent dehydrogenase (short-subunit alcohol dehydrogenase family)
MTERKKVALVTGAGRGMGKSVALLLARRGARLAINDISPASAEETTQEIQKSGGEAIAVPADITRENEVRGIVAKVAAHFGSLDILINNAGVLRPTKIIDIPEEEWDFVVNANLKSSFLCIKHSLPLMMKNGWGRIVNFSSTAGKNVSTLGGAHYTAAKAGVLGLTRHAAKEGAPFGITVNAVCPGLIDTEMVRGSISDVRLEQICSHFPISRLGKPDEVAELVGFLASDQAAYITGASLDINGGDLMI